jgi:hypothetical protein
MAKVGDCSARRVVALMSMYQPNESLKFVFSRVQLVKRPQELIVSAITQQLPLLKSIEGTTFSIEVGA